MREVTIYGIREVGSDAFVYVGATTNLSNRRSVGYSPRVESVLSRMVWEYAVLELTDAESERFRSEREDRETMRGECGYW